MFWGVCFVGFVLIARLCLVCGFWVGFVSVLCLCFAGCLLDLELSVGLVG